MGDLLGFLLEGVGHVLAEALNWFPTDSIDEGWAWPIGLCLAVAIVAFGFALYLGHAWLYQLAIGAAFGALGFVLFGAWCSRPSRKG
jgi:hypothetical protein